MFLQSSNYCIYVVFVVAVEPKRLAGRVEFAVSADLFVALSCSPFADVGVKALSITDTGGEQE